MLLYDNNLESMAINRKPYYFNCHRCSESYILNINLSKTWYHNPGKKRLIKAEESLDGIECVALYREAFLGFLGENVTNPERI